ncbi:SixA phosphatase family protein, partial [Bifidobacterium adolescentis]|uniref:SixA phosphatase family protein n=1 Tax=Bifidobacterium adolescentis TaxID=1680 RepID=UPI0034E8DA72|nr:phosphoglycerate mutase [Bifidobacterium adolescentis]
KGRKQAKAVAKGLAAFNMVPTRIACSRATRARQPCDRMLKVFGADPKVAYRQSLYEGGVHSVFDELSQTNEKHR